MSSPLSRNGLIGLGVGAAVSLGLIAFIIFKDVRRRKLQQVLREQSHRMLMLQGTTLDAHDGRAQQEPQQDAQQEAQQQALAAMETVVVHGLSPEQQQELKMQLDQVLCCVASLRSEVAELRGGLQDITHQIIQDVKKGVEDSQRVRRRRHVPKERGDSTSSSSVYFSASQGMASAYEETSEGGYSTAYAESDYTDQDTDREEGERLPEQESEEEEEEEDEDRSTATVLTLRQEDSPEEEVDDDRGLEEEEEEEEEDVKGITQLVADAPSGELALLLAQSDILHTGDGSLKAQGFRLLQDNRAKYGASREFLWRLARAYCDMYESTDDRQKKILYAQQGCKEAELALKKNGLDAECHKWFATLTRLSFHYESSHGKLRSSSILKEHVERALALRDDEPMCLYLLGRWCYEVATMDCVEMSAAAAIHQSPPNSTVHEALQNFLKAEELSPGFSKTVRLYIAKCHKELGEVSEATKWTELALSVTTNSDYDEEISELEAELVSSMNS